MGGYTVNSTWFGRLLTLSAISFCALATPPARADLEPLPQATTKEAEKFAILFDFDTDSCYPSPAVSKVGEINGGLKPTGGITGECRDKAQLVNSNKYYRKASITLDRIEYAVHMYAHYFKKDQFLSGVGGHRHDWEFALVSTRNGEVTHASCSAHGRVTTQPRGELHFDPGKDNRVKIVYHKDGIKTHSFRFAKADEEGDKNAENDLKRWLTPTIVD
jgi:hypothetical protein